MDWIAGLGLLTAIIGGGYLMGYAMFRHAFPFVRSDPKPTLRQVVDNQAKNLETRSKSYRSIEGLTERDWLLIAARHLMSLWVWMDLEQAVRELRDYMPDKYGHPDYDWSREAAEELAIEYARDFGEEFGSNS